MVLGLKGKHRRGDIVQADYRIHVQDIKPWPPSQSLMSLRSVFIQWENGDRHSGSSNLVIPTIGSLVGEGKIEFNESFKLPVGLVRDMSVRGKDTDTFQRNILEFHLFESRREKSAKGQLLASATIDLAEFGVVKEITSVTAPMHCQRNFKNTLQPILSFKIQPIDKGRTNNSLKDTLSRKMSLDSFDGESAAASIHEEFSDPNKIASFTDDDVSSHSSMTNSTALEPDGCVAHLTEEGDLSTLIHGTDNRQEHASTNLEPEKSNVTAANGAHGGLNVKSSSSSSIELSSDPGSPENSHTSISSSPKVGSMSIEKNGKKSYTVYFSSSPKHEPHESDIHNHVKIEDAEHLAKDSNGRKSNGLNYQEASIVETEEDVDHLSAIQGDTAEQVAGGNDAMSSVVQKNDRLKHVKSVRSPLESAKSNGFGSKQLIGVEETGAPGYSDNSVESIRRNERRDSKPYAKDTKNSVLDSKLQQLQHKIKMLEGELREAAAIEAALYSIVAEHGSSMNKVHAPARRLSRLYLHSCKESSQSRKAHAARSVVSGFVLIAKACGNDVPRLTFWLSNSIVLRTIVSQDAVSLKKQVASGSHSSKNGANRESSKAASALKWKASSPNRRENGNTRHGSSGDWEDAHTFTSALEKVEAWIFSRIIESIWWQTLTPHMQSATAKTINQVSNSASGKSYKRSSSSVDHDQGNFSLDLWKKAFKDACERICPVRAGGHECGCLPLLSRLIMEQCVSRLDTAMFNAILRDSADEMPTDPVSDPISESKVLPIPVGKSSFGAGALLKNAIGNWSRWLTDLFGLDDDDQCEDENDNAEGKDATTLKSFHLLNALSDLMMLPKDMLLNQSIRKEVCPSFGAPVIKRILEHFVPDEFCEDPIPDAVLEALDIEEDPSELDNKFVTSLPHAAAAAAYHPPSVASVAAFIGDIGTKSELKRSRSSVLRKSNTSDDELDELCSPFASILEAAISPSTTGKSSRTYEKSCSQNGATRYNLLRDVWGE